MNKKGTEIFNAFLVIFFIVIFVTAIFIYTSLRGKEERVVGDASVEIINLYLKAEKDLIYLDSNVRLTSFKVLKEMSNEGLNCGKEDCLDEFERVFLEKFSTYFDYESYDFEVVDDGFFISGIAKDKKEYGAETGEGVEITYIVKQNFKQKIDYRVESISQRILTENGFETIQIEFNFEEEEINL